MGNNNCNLSKAYPNAYSIIKKALIIMFKKFKLTDEQFDKLISCYNANEQNKGSNPHIWIDALVKTKFQFADEQIKKVEFINYNSLKLRVYLKPITMEELEKSFELTEKWRFFENIIKNNNLIPPTKQCMINIIQNYDGHPDNLKKYLNGLTKLGCIPDNECFTELIKKNTKFQDEIKILLKNGVPLSEENFRILCQEEHFHSNCIEYFFKNGYKPAIDTLNYCIENGQEFTELKHNPFGKDFPWKDKKDRLLNIFSYFNVAPNIESLNLSIVNYNIQLAKSIIDKFNVMPNKDTLDASIKLKKPEVMKDILDYKIEPDEKTFDILLEKHYTYPSVSEASGSGSISQPIDSTINILELLIKYGLQLNISMAEKLIRLNINIKDLDRFGISYDNTLYQICHKYNKFPKDIKQNLGKHIGKIFDLRMMCKNCKTTVDKFRKFMIDNKIQPDTYCLEYACGNNFDLASYMLIDLKLEPTINCVIEYYKAGWISCDEIEKILMEVPGIDIKCETYDIDLDNLPEVTKIDESEEYTSSY